MFNKDEIEKLKIENESLRNQLEVKEMMFQQLKEQYQHKNNELSDLIADVFLGFRKITEKIELPIPTKVINSSIKENLYKFTSFAF